MSEPTLQDLKDLILAMDKKSDLRYSELERTIDNRFNEFERKVDTRFAEIDLRFAELERTIDNRFNEMDKKLEIGISEVKGEIKRLDEKMIGIDKRLGNEEFVSRSVMITIAAGLVTGVTKFVFFN